MESTATDQITGCNIEPRTAVIGIGGAGCNVVSDVYWADGSVDTIAINTDREALKTTDADKKLYICKEVMKGEGTQGDNFLGRRCAKFHSEEITAALEGYDTVFIVAGMGGGTGSGVAPVVADIAQKLNIITFAILIDPFSFESARTKVAYEGIAQMKAICKMTTVIENDLVLKNMPHATVTEAFSAVNNAISRFVSEQKRKITNSFISNLPEIEDVVKDQESFPSGDLTERIKSLN